MRERRARSPPPQSCAHGGRTLTLQPRRRGALVGLRGDARRAFAGCGERCSRTRRRCHRHGDEVNNGSPAVFVQPCRLTISLIQIGAKGDVQPFDTG